MATVKRTNLLCVPVEHPAGPRKLGHNIQVDILTPGGTTERWAVMDGGCASFTVRFTEDGQEFEDANHTWPFLYLAQPMLNNDGLPLGRGQCMAIDPRAVIHMASCPDIVMWRPRALPADCDPIPVWVQNWLDDHPEWPGPQFANAPINLGDEETERAKMDNTPPPARLLADDRLPDHSLPSLDPVTRATLSPTTTFHAKHAVDIPPHTQFAYFDDQQFNPPVSAQIDYPTGSTGRVIISRLAVLEEAPTGVMAPIVMVAADAEFEGGHIKAGTMIQLDPRGVVRHGFSRELYYEPRKYWDKLGKRDRQWLASHPEWPTCLWQPPNPMTTYGNHLDALDALAYHRNRMAGIPGATWAQDTSEALGQAGARPKKAEYPNASEEHKAAVAMLQQAVPYYWTPTMIDLVRQAATQLPEDATLTQDVLVSPAGFAWLAKPIQWPRQQPGTQGMQWLSGWSWLALSNRLLWMPWVYEYADGRWVTLPGIMNEWEWGMPIATYLQRLRQGFDEILAEDAPKAERYVGYYKDYLSLMLSACLFVQQRILVHSSVAPERHLRKRLAREHKWEQVPDVQVVELRRRQHIGPPKDATDTEPVEWSCQWWVEGFWRNQAYGPGYQQHRRIWVSAFLKGPEDKPIKPRAIKLYRVDR